MDDDPAQTTPAERPASDLRVLIVEDDHLVRSLMAHELEEGGLTAEGVGGGKDALRFLAESPPDAMLLDLGLPDIDGRSVLAQVRERWPHVPVVVVTATEGAETAASCMRDGATDYLVKPFDTNRLVTSARNAAERGRLEVQLQTLRGHLHSSEGFQSFLGSSRSTRSAIELLQRAARSEVTVLIEGESGTGKEVAARALHMDGDRTKGPFIAINCGALPSALVESELFGHCKGAFTGAVSDRAGCFEEASGGTLFLDEIGELPMEAQVRLLRVLQERVVQRVGSAKPIDVDVRVVAATNRDLRAEVEAGRFREDLYYRVAVFPVQLPPLRDRDQDALLLAHAFLDDIPAAPGGFSKMATRAILGYRWPGNVRELRNAMERASVLEDSDLIRVSSLPPEVVQASFPDGLPDADAQEAMAMTELSKDAALAPKSAASTTGGELFPLDKVLQWEEYERAIVANALRVHGWCIKDTLADLGIGRATLYRKIERYGLERPEPKS